MPRIAESSARSDSGEGLEDDDELNSDEIQLFLDAVVAGDEAKIKSLISADGRLLNAKATDTDEYGLLVAVGLQKVNIVKLFLKYPDIEFDDDLLEYAQSFTFPTLPTSTTEPAREIYQLLVERQHEGEDEDEDGELTAREKEEQEILFTEIDDESVNEVRSILTQFPRLLEREFDADDDGTPESPLLRALNTQSIELVRLLLTLGASVNSEIVEYATELWQNAGDDEEDNARDILRLLQAPPPQAQGEEEEEDEEEGEPLTIAELAGRKKLHEAIESGDNVTAIAVLTQYPKLANVPYSGETPLTNAVSSRNLEFVKHLIDGGVYADEDDLDHAEYLAGHTTTGLSEEEKKLANDIVAVIQRRFPVVPPRALDFGAEPAGVPVKLEVVEVSYTDMPTAYDMLEMEDIALFDLITSGEKMIFKVKDIYFSTDLTPLQSAMQDKSSTFYECKKELDGTPYTKDVHVDTPYFRVQLNGNFTVPEKQIQAAVDSKYSIFELVPSEKKLAFVASYASVQITPGKDGLGRQVNILSADHCQKGSQQVTYTLKAVTMVKKKAGGARKTYRKGGKKSNKRKTIRRRK
jgi:hypothetical protein